MNALLLLIFIMIIGEKFGYRLNYFAISNVFYRNVEGLGAGSQ